MHKVQKNYKLSQNLINVPLVDGCAAAAVAVAAEEEEEVDAFVVIAIGTVTIGVADCC